MADMKITVEMSAELFEEFMQFRKCKDTYENKAQRQIDGLRGRMNALAKAVIESVEGKTPKDKKAAKEEIKNALFSGCQVEHNGIIYKCVSAIIYRLREGKLLLQAELLDKNCNSVIIADASRVKEVNL